MKNYVFLLSIMISLILSSCGKEEISQDITGVWRVAAIEQYNCDDPINNQYIDYTNIGCVVDSYDDCVETTFDFKSDGTFTTIITIRLNGQMEADTLSGSTYTTTSDEVEICDGETCHSGSIEDGKITINGELIGPICDADMILERE